MVPVGKSRLLKIELTLFLLGLMLIFLIHIPLQRELLHLADGLKQSLIQNLENQWNVSISYKSLGPSIFSTIDIRNITVKSKDDDHVMLRIQRLRLGYSLWQVLQGNVIDAFRSVRIEKPIAAIDLVKDAEFLKTITGSDPGRSDSQENPASILFALSFKQGLQIRILNGSVQIVQGTQSAVLNRININSTLWQDNLEIKSSVAIALKTPDFFSPDIAGSFTTQGTVSLKSLTGEIKITLSNVNTSLFSVKKIALNMIFSKDAIQLYKIEDRLPYALDLSYQIADRSLRGALQFVNFSPRQLLEPAPSLKMLSPWLDSSLSGTLKFNYGAGKPFEYQVSLQGHIPLPWEDTVASAEITGSGSNLRADKLSLTSSQGRVHYAGAIGISPLVINGTLEFDRVMTKTNTPVSGSFRIDTKGSDYYLFGESFTIGSFMLSAIDAHINKSGANYSWDLSALHFLNEESYEDVQVSRIFSDGVYSSSDTLVQGTIKVDGLPLSAVTDVVSAFVEGLPDISENYTNSWFASTELFIASDGKHVSYTSPRLILTGQSSYPATIIASVAGTERQVSIQSGRVILKDGTADFSGQAEFSDPMDIQINASLTYQNTMYTLQVAILDFKNITLRGSYGLSAALLLSDNGFWSGYCKVDALPLPIRTNRVLVSFDAGFKYFNPLQWSVDVHTVDIQNIPGFAQIPLSIALGGTINQEGAQFSDLHYTDAGGTLSGKASFSWKSDFSSPQLSLYVADNLAVERYEAELVWTSAGVDGRLYMSKANLDRFYLTTLAPLMTGEFRFNWTSFEQFSIDWKIASLQFRWSNQDVFIASAGSLTPDSVELVENVINVGSLQADIASLTINQTTGDAKVTSRIRGTLATRSLDVYANISLQMRNLLTFPDLIKQANQIGLEGTVTISNGYYDTWKITDPIVLSLQKSDQGFSLKGGPQNALRLEVAADGSYYLAFANPLPLRGSITGSLVQGNIEANTQNLYIDLTLLWGLLPENLPIKLTGGFALATLSIQGSLSDPSFSGDIRASSVRMLIPDWIQDELGPASITATLEGNTMEIPKVLIPAGNGKIEAQGTVLFDRWLPGNFTFTGTVPEIFPIGFKSSLFGIHANGKAWGLLQFASNEGNLLLQGNLVAQDTLVTFESTNEPDSQNNTSTTNFRTSLSLQIGKKVEFIWPNTNVPVLRAYADIGSIINIASDSDTERYSVNGDITLRGGEVFYFQRSFYIRSGQLTFNENEVRFDPRIALRAELRDRTSDGPVTIALIIDNAPLSNFTPRFISEPPLSQIDIFALLGQNVAGSSGPEAANSLQDAVLNASSDILAQFNVVRLFEQSLRDTLNLDMFSVRTQVLQNALLQASGLRTNPVDRTTALGNYFDNTTIYLGKYFGPDFFVQSMVSLRYDPLNQDTLFGGLTVEPEIGAELRSPLFTINWNFVPKTGESLFINSQSITISWKWSF